MKYILVIGCILLIGCESEKPIDSLEKYFDSQFQKDEPGGSIFISHEDKIILNKSYGISDIRTGEKITDSTLFNTGSISKTFVANVILMLAAEEKLSLQDSIIAYFPDFKNHELGKKVRIIHLLTHTSGLPDNRRQYHDSVFLLTAKDLENFAPLLLNDSLAFEPGTAYDYSNPAFNALALIIEKVTGKKWQAVVSERIFQPAGMKNSVITDGSFPESGVAHGYLKIQDHFIEKDYGEEPTFAAAGNGGVWSNVRELVKYEQALQRHLLLSPENLKQSRSVTTFPQWDSASPPFIGICWFLEETQDQIQIASHTGTQGGFYCDFVSIPEKKLLYIMLCNTPKPREEFRSKVMDFFQTHYWNN